MEETRVSDELRPAEVNGEPLRERLEQAYAQASELKAFTLQLKDFEDYFDVIRGKLEKSSQEVKSKETELEERAIRIKAAEAEAGGLKMKVDGYRREVEAKQKELAECSDLVQESKTELRLQQNQLTATQESVKKAEGELELMEKRLSETRAELERHRSKMAAEKENLVKVQNEVRQCEEEERKQNKLSQGDDKISELSLVKEQLGSQQKLLEMRSSELESKEKELDGVRELLEKHEVTERKVEQLRDVIRYTCDQIDLKTTELGEIEKSIVKQADELATKLKQCDSIKLSLKEHKEEFKLKEKQFAVELEAKRNSCSQIERSMEELTDKFVSKEQELDSIKMKIQKSLKEFESKEEQYAKLLVSLKGREEELELKEKQLAALVKKCEQKEQQLESLKDLGKFAKDFELKVKEKVSSCLRGSIDEENVQLSAVAPVNDVPINNTTRPPSLDIQQNTEILELVCRLPKEEDAFMCDEVSDSLAYRNVSECLHLAQNPEKVVLGLLQGVVLGTHEQGEPALEVKDCVLLLEELMRVAPRQIEPPLQIEASELAKGWKGKMNIKTPTSLEALGFLQFIVVYGLVQSFSQDEISKLACSIAHYKHAPKLFQSLGDLSSVIRKIIPELIKGKQYIPAVRFICSFELNGEFSPVPLLNEEIKTLRQSACNVSVEKTSIESQAEGKVVGKMRAILELIADYKLEIDLPGDLIAKFVNFTFQLAKQNQSLPSEGPTLPPTVPTEPTSLAIHGSDASHPRSPGALSHPQALGALDHQACSIPSYPDQSQNLVGSKRQRTDPQA